MSHGLMFHHFHDKEIHQKGQGSISSNDLEILIKTVKRNFNILNAPEYIQKASDGTLQQNDLTLTFDDALKCQYDIAAPILKKYDINAFFFVYSSVFGNNPDPLEYYRDFRNTYFEDLDSFYRSFFDELTSKYPDCGKKYAETYPQDYLESFPFYTENDRRFRFVRDKILGVERYNSLLESMMLKLGYCKDERRSILFMDKQDIASLSCDGHVIGLHSHTHPTQIHLLDEKTQRREYEENLEFLKKTLAINPQCMSHPCGNYNNSTISILRSLGISIGFRSSMTPSVAMSNLEIPREDHANVMKQIKKTGIYTR